ncbi:MAG TPA: non-homologous end-joining DNA ligase [Candidatus Acidoferrales bacterium]|nr:non-homologous end-joining DNA ligase [Candidatus Acidoferrales bacterium]
MTAAEGVEVQVEDRTLRLSSLDKVLWPDTGFTKGQMIDYYTRIAPFLLPHLRDRPLTLKRYPDGVGGQMFYEKNCPKHRPPWVDTARVWSGGNARVMFYCMAQDLPTLVWIAQLGTIELHTSLSHRQKMEEPSALVFDLDPGSPATIVECCQVAIWLREWFAGKNMVAFCKTSGSKGLQIYAPLNRSVDYQHTKLISKGLAETLERDHPELVVHLQRKSLREGKVLIDWSQNDQYKTTVNVYSLRARSRPTVSTPVEWEEIEACLESGDPGRLVFDSFQVLERTRLKGDLFEPVLKLKQQLPASL